MSTYETDILFRLLECSRNTSWSCGVIWKQVHQKSEAMIQQKNSGDWISSSGVRRSFHKIDVYRS